VDNETQGQNPQEKSEFDKKLEEIKAENARMEKNIAQIKELKAMEALSGSADAGQKKITPEEETELKVKKMADEIVKAFKE
jgi:hypothetical protein